jgi:putative addiction module component (TIGR02574 family)
MSTVSDDLKIRLAGLPTRERAELACYLIESLDATVDEDAEVAWDAELERREQEIRSNQEEGEPASHLFARLRPS